MSTYHFRWGRFLTVPCRTCGQPVGEKCRITVGEHKGEIARVAHAPRWDDSIQKEHDDAKSKAASQANPVDVG